MAYPVNPCSDACRQTGCAWTCETRKAYHAACWDYFVQLQRFPASVVAVGFCTARDMGQFGGKDARLLVVRRVFRADAPLLIAEFEAECARLESCGQRILVRPRILGALSAEVERALQENGCRGHNGAAVEMDMPAEFKVRPAEAL